MVGKVSEKALAREGLERTDNGMRMTSWPDVAAINQKNYYTDYMKRDDQILALRLQAEANRDKLVQSHRERDRDRALAKTGAAAADTALLADDNALQLQPQPDVVEAAQVIVIHPGSQNLRIGLASDALPRTIPMAVATRHVRTEADGVPPRPVRADPDVESAELLFGDDWARLYQTMCDDLKADMRLNKRKLPPNPKEQVLNFNRRTEPEVIAQHNDPLQVEWTDPFGGGEDSTGRDGGDGVPKAQPSFVGIEAQRLPDDSDPPYRLVWPMQHGCLNEDSFASREEMFSSFEAVLERAIRHDLGIPVSQLGKYHCLFVIPDLYDKRYVEQLLRSATGWFQFSRVCFMQESLAATFGAGYTQACVVDVGAQKTSVSCVEDGVVAEDSRVNIKYGGHDVTETFIKMMLHDNFPYRDINLNRRHDFLLAEELKIKHCTMNQAQVSPGQPQIFHVRAPGRPTRRYQFKMFDEIILAPMGFFEPAIFDAAHKLRSRRKLVPLSVNSYDVDLPDDPTPAAQTAILALTNPAIGAPPPAPTPAPAAPIINAPTPSDPAATAPTSTPMKEKTQPFTFSLRYDLNNNTPSASKAPSPAPDGASTPMAGGGPPFAFSAGGSPAPSGAGIHASTPNPNPVFSFVSLHPIPAAGGADHLATTVTPRDIAIERDSVLPIAPLDVAVMTSITHAARGDDRRARDLLGSIMVVGGGAKVPHLTAVLEDRLRARYPDVAPDKILVSRSARDMDEQVVVWKGASVFAKLPTNDSWITPYEVERLGSRALFQRLMFNF